MFDIVFRRLGEYILVILVDKGVTRPDHWRYFVHHTLKCSYHVLQSKRHYYKLIQTMVGSKSRPLPVFFVNWNLPIATVCIQSGEHLCVPWWVYTIIDSRQGIRTSHRDRIQLPLVYAEASYPIIFAYKNDRWDAISFSVHSKDFFYNLIYLFLL